MTSQTPPITAELTEWLQLQSGTPLLILRCRNRQLIQWLLSRLTDRDIVLGDLTQTAIDQLLTNNAAAVPKIQTGLYIKDERLRGFHSILVYCPTELKSAARWHLFEQALLQQAYPQQLLLYDPEQAEQWSAWSMETVCRLPNFQWSLWPLDGKEPQGILFHRENDKEALP